MRDQPEKRAEYFKGMIGAWVMLQVAVILTMSIPTAVAGALDRDALPAVASVAAGLETFRIAGALLAAWWYYAAREARRRGAESAEYRRALLRATSSGQTVIYQALLGVAVGIIVLAA
jgi:hypothetical protein